MDEVVIGSPGTTLTLSEFVRPYDDGWCTFRATIEGGGLRATCVIADHLGLGLSEERTGTLGLVALVRATAEEYRGWAGAKRWESTECQLRLAVTSDTTGHATFEVQLSESGGGWGWRAQTAITLDVMERERLERELAAFLQTHRAA